ncbi:MAG: 3'(2'),5'-bisphosphate nucleotidase CysQ [Ferrovibrio sp.]|nr:3'(2'),5'-bisphosphate nucleotidase CysQ [Ferrovibrio sp.]MBP7062853.1 3'(2'),5'-bisphosphate nucleotidase CysQ [Ferrovibrio sp.]
MGLSENPALAAGLRALAQQAADAIMQVYATPFESRAKDDHSPVTDADEAAEAVILAGLAQLCPGVPVVAEECAARGEIPAIGNGPFWLVDPLDGTREFIKRNGEFTVNIALIEQGRPRLGVVLTPVDGRAYLGTPGGARRFRDATDQNGEPIQARAMPAEGADVLLSRSHPDPELAEWLAGQKVRRRLEAGSSLKFCRIAEGAADLYPRFARISEWDTAAGQAVLEAAGGSVRDWQGRPLLYGKPDFRNPGYLARGRD